MVGCSLAWPGPTSCLNFYADIIGSAAPHQGNFYSATIQFILFYYFLLLVKRNGFQNGHSEPW